MATTIARPTENAAVGRCKRSPKPRRGLLDIALLRAIAIRNRDHRGIQLFTAMLRRLIGVEVVW